MANLSSRCVTHTPIFYGIDFNKWKNEIEIFICSRDIQQWKNIIIGYESPMNINDFEINDISHLTCNQLKNYSTHNKVLNALVCALDIRVYNQVSHCKTAKEIWTSLEIIYK